MPKLKAAVYVQDPTTREELILLPGKEPEPRLVELVTNPDAWETPPEDEGPEPIAPGEPDPTGRGESEPDASGSGTGGVKKAPQRRTRSASASSS